MALCTAAAGFALAWAAAPAPAFPHAAARLYLEAAQPPPTSLSSPSRPPSAAAVAAAEARLRRLADGRGHSTAALRDQALAAFVLGTGEGERGDLVAAVHDLTLAAAWAPSADAALATLAQFQSAAHDDAGVLRTAALQAWNSDDVFYRPLATLAANSAATLQQWPQVLAWCQKLPQTTPVLWLQAQADAATGQAHAAALLQRELVYRFPASEEARAAQAAWRASLAAYPDLSPDWKLIALQAAAWSAAGQARPAAASWARAASLAPTAEQPALLAHQARSTLASGDRTQTEALLGQLLTGPERAQGLELQIEMARAQKSAAALEPGLATLAREFPASSWYARALHEAGDEALIEGDGARVQRFFDQLATGFPQSVYAPEAAWQATWVAYRLGQPDIAGRLDHYLAHFPHGSDVPDALYWRGAWALAHHAPSTARSYFGAAATWFPGTYFGEQAQLQLGAHHAGKLPDLPGIHDATAPAAAPLPANLGADVERADWLAGAGLLDPAATILQARLRQLPRGAASLNLARRLAALDRQRQDEYGALVAMLRAVPEYLELHPGELRLSDWKRLYPEPQPDDVALVARRDHLDRYLLLGLIRQESAFNSNSISGARARGLTQLELGTARGHFGKLPRTWRALAGGGGLQAADLLNPSLNVALGAAELQSLLERFHNTTDALIGYNAGASRVILWHGLFPNLEGNEFIETIPFAQTREYVQAVLRNRAHYAAIYGK